MYKDTSKSTVKGQFAIARFYVYGLLTLYSVILDQWLCKACILFMQMSEYRNVKHLHCSGQFNAFLNKFYHIKSSY